MPEVNLVPILDQLKQEATHSKEVQAIRVPEKVGGKVDMILGFLYAKVYPEPVHVFDNGCTLFRTKLLQSDGNIQGVIGGPIGAFNHLADQTGVNAAVSWMMTTAAQVRNFRPRTDFNSIAWKPDHTLLEHAEQEGPSPSLPGSLL